MTGYLSGDAVEKAVIVDSVSLTAGTPETVDTSDVKAPVVCVQLEDLEGAADDTVTVEMVTPTGTYEVDSRTLSATGSYVVSSTHANQHQITSSNGVTYSAEVRSNPN